MKRARRETAFGLLRLRCRRGNGGREPVDAANRMDPTRGSASAESVRVSRCCRGRGARGRKGEGESWTKGEECREAYPSVYPGTIASTFLDDSRGCESAVDDPEGMTLSSLMAASRGFVPGRGPDAPEQAERRSARGARLNPDVGRLNPHWSYERDTYAIYPIFEQCCTCSGRLRDHGNIRCLYDRAAIKASRTG